MAKLVLIKPKKSTGLEMTFGVVHGLALSLSHGRSGLLASAHLRKSVRRYSKT